MAPSPATVLSLGWATLLGAAALALPARAQDARDEAPVQTIPDEPELSPQQADRKARDLFKQGRDAYEDGRYRDSWDYFRQAYVLSKRPELLYNVGQSADRLRMDREALEAFRLYLAKLPDAENRREVENRVRALEERLGSEAGSAPPPPEEDPAYLTAEGEDEAGIFGSESAAEPEAQPDAAPVDSAETSARDGWYARVGLGLGVLGDAVGGLREDATLSAGTVLGHAALGYGIAEGVVVGGALMFEWGLGATVKSGDLSVDVDTANLTLFGPFMDYYFAPHDDGWHALAGLSLAWFSLSERGAVIGAENASGGALVLGGGYDWPAFDEEWTIGALGRLILAKVDQDVGKHTLVVLSAAGTLTWY